MPLNFLKKLADKLLSKKPSADKPAKGGAAAKKDARGPGRGAKPQDRPANAKQGGRGWEKRSQRADGHRAPNAPRSGRAGAPKPQPNGRGGEPSLPKTAQERPQQGRQGGPAQTPSGGRSIAHPESSHSRGDRGDRGGRGGDRRGRGRGPVQENTAEGRQRPGGAATTAEMEKLREAHSAWSVEQYQVEPAEGKRRFHDFDLPAEILHAVADKNFQYCTPIQSMSLEHALAGKDVAGRAQTGTGKTAAFLVAILTRYLRTPESRQQQGGAPRALVIAPTRELVIQICKDAAELGKYCGLRSLAVYGGMDYDRQRNEVRDAPVDLLVATPGRLLDFVRSRVIDLSKVDTLVIDEADRMLDMGFIPDVRSIIHRLPPKEKRCTMLYSATLDDEVMRLAAQWMVEPVRIEVESEQVQAKAIKQIVYVVTSNEKFTVLYNHIQQFPDSRILVFCNRKTTTEDVAHSLSRRGIKCETLSGDVNQNRRLRVLEDFREGKVRLVIATDVAGRGLHVDNIGFVINFDFPYAPEDYVHRIGRTGRAGQSGVAISFADEDESFIIPDIEKFIGEELRCTMLQSDDPLLAAIPDPNRRGGPRGGPPAPAPEQAENGAGRTEQGTPEKTEQRDVSAEQEPPKAPAPTAQPSTHNPPRAPAPAKPRPPRQPPQARHLGRRGPPPPRPEPPRSANVHRLPPPGGRPGQITEEWVPGSGT